MSWKGILRKAGITSDGANVDIRGILTAANIITTQGEIFYLDAANGSDNNDGKHPDRAFATLPIAYAALTANQNDVLIYLSGATSISLATTLTWAKDYTHFLGVCAPVGVANRARIFNSGNTGNSPLLTVSGNGCVFKDLYLFQGSSAADTRCVDVTGERNYFENVHFAGMGHATAGADVPACSLKLTGSECKFKDCTIGLDTIVRAAANAELLVDSAATRNTFEHCKFISYSETAGKFMCTWADSTACDRWMIFEDCLFINFSANHATTLTEAFNMPATNATFDVILAGNCLLVGITEWEAGDVGNLWIGTPAPAAATSGIAVEPAT